MGHERGMLWPGRRARISIIDILGKLLETASVLTRNEKEEQKATWKGRLFFELNRTVLAEKRIIFHEYAILLKFDVSEQCGEKD